MDGYPSKLIPQKFRLSVVDWTENKNARLILQPGIEIGTNKYLFIRWVVMPGHDDQDSCVSYDEKLCRQDELP
jgi:hypothetical protein